MPFDFENFGNQTKKNKPQNDFFDKLTPVKETEQKFFGGKTGQEFIAQPKVKQIMQAFVATLPKDIYDFAIKTPVEFGKSVAEAIPTIVTGGKITPELGGYVSEAKQAVQQNKGLVKSLILPSIKTAGAGLETLGLLKAGEKFVSFYSNMTAEKKATAQVLSSLSKKEKLSAGARNITGSKMFGIKEIPTKYDKEIINVSKPFVNNNIVKTENNIKNVVKKMAVDLSDNIKINSKVITGKDKSIILSEINKLNPSLLTKNDPIRRGIYSDFLSRIKNSIANATNDNELFEIRKILDDVADAETNGKIWENTGKMNPVHEIWRDARKIVNKFIGNRIPNTTESLKQQSLLYDALEGVAEKTGQLIGKPGQVQKALKSGLRIGAGIAAGAAGGYAVTKTIVGR